MKEQQMEDKHFRATINYGIRTKITDEIESNRIRSASLKNNIQYIKFIPKLRPVNTNLNPSPIKLTGKEDIYIEDEKFSIKHHKKSSKKLLRLKIKENKIEEEIDENIVNSTDEGHSHRLSHIVTDSSDNDSKENEKNNGKNDIGCMKHDGDFPNINKKLNYCISHIRGKLDKIKNKIKLKNCKDDSMLNISYKKYLSENYRIECAQNYINKLKLEAINEYNKYKNKTISFRESKSHKPPILGFLQMNEISANSTLSSCNLSEI